MTFGKSLNCQVFHAGSQLLKNKCGRDKDSCLTAKEALRGLMPDRKAFPVPTRKECLPLYKKWFLVIIYSSLFSHLDKTRTNSTQPREGWTNAYLFMER